MGPSNMRVAAGVGVVAAVVMVGGPTAAVAVADPGGSHSNHSGPRDNGDARGGWKPGGGGRDGGGYGDRDSDGGDRDYAGGYDDDRGGSGGYGGKPDDRGGGNDRWGGDDADGGSGQPTTSGGDSNQRSASSSSRTGTASLAPQTATGSSQDSADQPGPAPQTPADGPGSDTVSGADAAAPPAAAEPVRPRVVFGNGRSPGIHQPAPAPPRLTVGVPEVAPPSPPPVIVPPAPSSTERSRPQRFVPQFAQAPSANWRDPLWGLAGLVLIPAAGAVLGYRQAKAVRDAEVLTRT